MRLLVFHLVSSVTHTHTTHRHTCDSTSVVFSALGVRGGGVLFLHIPEGTRWFIQNNLNKNETCSIYTNDVNKQFPFTGIKRLKHVPA